MASSMRLDPGWLQSQLGGSVALPELTPATAIVGLVAVILVPVLLSSLVGTRKPPHPDANGGSGFKFEAQLSADFIRNGIHILREARKKFSGKPFLLHSHQGLVTVLPNHMTGDVRNNRDLNFRKRVVMDGFTWLPGFSSASVLDRPDSLLQKVITKHLTKRLNTITGPLALEAIYAVEKALDTSAKDWKEVKIYDAVLDMVARLSSRIFLGPELCRNEEWLEITKTFTVHLTLATAKVRMFPVWMAPIVCLFDSSCRTVREMNVRAAKIVEPMVLNRREERAECAAKGVEPPVYSDLIEWIEIENGGKPYPILDMQLAMSFVATHTTSDLLCQTLLQLANAPEHIEPLRKELVEMLSTQGWKKTSLYGMKLLDSTIKEAQRTKPVQELSLLRVAEKDVTLSDGTLIRKGEKTVVEVSNMDPAKYENPAQFNPRRYLEMRETPGGEHKAQLVSTTADNVSFGFGIYACPGRFFAANEIKILLINLLLKYDWKMAPGTTTEPMYIAADPLINPEAKLMYKPRRPEIDLDNVNVESVDV